MATINFVAWAGQGWDMAAAHWPQPGSAIAATETTAVFKLVYGAGYADTFTGSGFHYDSNFYPYAGTISTWSSLAGGATVFSATGLNVPVSTFMQAFYGGDWSGLLNYALSGNDTINGSTRDDSLAGYGGNDTINGGTGNDFLDGGSGNDTLNGGSGTDIMAGRDGDDTYIVDSPADVVQEASGAGTDTVKFATNISTGYANVENYTYIGTGNWTFTGNGQTNFIIGGAGNDVLSGGGGNDVLVGGAGIDTVSYAGVGIAMTINLAQNYASGQGYTADGISQIENVIGGSGKDTITGDFNANRLDGGASADVMDGGGGNDTYIVDNDADIVAETLSSAAGGTDLVLSAVSIALGNNIENVTLTAGAGVINAMGNDLANVMTGNESDNSLNGGAGNDTLIGGLGNDSYVVDNAADKVVELAGQGTHDLVEADFTYSLATLVNIEDLRLVGSANINGTGNAAGNIITGNDGDNILDGAAGNDTLSGGLGNDTYVLDNANDSVSEFVGEGNDTIKEGFGDIDLNNALYANIENVTLTGTKALNATGTSGDNTLIGNTAANHLIGGDDNDILDGGAGNDILDGGDGDDIYYVDSLKDTITDTSGTDEVRSAKISIDLLAQYDGVIENATLTGTAALNLSGNGGANTLIGNDGANTLNGAGGQDTLRGGKGGDTYIIDSADDIVDEAVGDNGIDLVKSAVSFDLSDDEVNATHSTIENLILTGSDNINGLGNDLANIITGNSGKNTLSGGKGNDTLTGGDGDDTYIVDSIGDKVIELAGKNSGIDTVQASISFSLAALANVENVTLTGTDNINATGNAVGNTLIGNGGDNLLDGGAGNDKLSGGLGDDTYILDNAGDEVHELDGEGTDTVKEGFATLDLNDAAYAFIENATLTGSKAFNLTGTTDNNALTGNTAANTLTGGDGDDTLDGGGGKDILDGGDGDDRYIIDSADDTIKDSAGDDTVQSAKISLNLANWVGIENATLTGIAALNLTGDGNANLLIGNDGANTLDGHGGQDTLRGGKGGDTYIVDSADDIVDETGTDKGIDLVKSGVSFDLSTNAPGSDHSSIENLILTGTDNIDGTGNTLNNVITGNSGANMLTGGKGNDTLTGGDGNDILDGGAGTDAMTGGKGDDSYIVDSLSDKVVELAGQGSDLIQASISYSIAALANIENLSLSGSANINATGNAAANNLFGNSGDNVINGGAGNDELDGYDGNDTLIGGTGDDRLDGGKGDDVMTGGAGADLFFFDSVLDAGTGKDRITDFTRGVDKIDISLLMTAFGNPADPLTDGYYSLVTSGKDTIIQVDHDGSKGADLPVPLVTVQNVHLTADDIISFFVDTSHGGDDIITLSSGGDDTFTIGSDLTVTFVQSAGALTVLDSPGLPVTPGGDYPPISFGSDSIFQLTPTAPGSTGTGTVSFVTPHTAP